MTKVLVATDKPFAAIAVKGIREVVEAAGMELALLEKYTGKSQLLEAVKDVDALIVRSDVIDAEVLGAARKLKIVVRAGAGYDNVDLAAATARGICIMNTPGQNSNAVAELVFGLLVYGARGFYSATSGTELKGRKLGILAFGNVGRNVARIAKGFDMEVYAFDPYMPAKVIENDGVKALGSMAELFGACQVVSLHIPATAETKKSISYELLKSMPQGAILVNTARREVVDEDALKRIFEERPDFKYLSDIQPTINAELAAGYPGRYFATPVKLGAQTAEANINAGIASARQIVDFIRNGNIQFKVN
ncbi:MAG: 3-phosphoglycerate dehydrogenase [Tannerellaceae bacterium]|jgi:D-3-phosphoglycerate dehydrogenase|nr:3-phosphoglycerate dehydrogenase [Tannerellaceae bacterium]